MPASGRGDRGAEARWMQARGVYQYLPANSSGDELIIYDDAGSELERLSFPRQPEPGGLW